jgi:CheY-like chemotaxis protein
LARKILLADDSVTAQNMGRKILADAGYEVITVNNGSAALKRVTESKPDLIVLDVYMPGYSGLEVCQRLKDSDDTAHIPVLLTVGKLEPFKPDDARRVRADAHIVKPFEASELLTAVMKLEDRVVATKAEGSRHGAENGRNAPGTDTGWKSRLGFPSKKKKEDAEDEGAAGGNFREFRSGKGKSNASEAAGEKAASRRGANPVSNITPEELDALSAVAAKLDGASPAVEKSAVAAVATAVPVVVPTVAPIAVPTTVPTDSAKADSGVAVPVEAPAAKIAAARTEVKGFAVVASAAVEAVAAKEERADVAASVDSASFDSVALAVAVPVSAVEVRNEIGIPVEHLEVAAERPAVADTTATSTSMVVAENRNPENQSSEASAAAVVNSTAPAQEPALVEQSAQPVFGSAAAAVVASSTSSDASAALTNAAESRGETAETPEPKVEALPAEDSVVPVAVRAPEADAEGLSPSDEELAQALRLLTPSVNAEMASGTATAGGPRWVAESIALSGEEAAISLEAEMFGSFAAKPSVEAEAGRRITGVSAITAAVETRLAAVGLGAGASALPAPESAAALTSAAPAEQQNDSTGAPEKTAEKVSEAIVTEAGVAEDLPTATFAGGGDSRDEIRAEFRAAGDANVVAAPETTAVAAVAEFVTGNRDSSSRAEAEESMSKDAKSNTEKSNGQQVSEPAAAEIRGEIAEMAMSMAAAAAAAEGSAPSPSTAGAISGTAASSSTSSSSSSSSDAGAIASIVDSVMADLRPKIVEEIAKRLAGK